MYLACLFDTLKPSTALDMLNEKTLELNLTFEMLTVADQLWSLTQFATSAPRVMRSCHCFRPSRMPSHARPPYAIGLTLQEEKRKGWDVHIQFPPGPGCPSHALFMQFKAGEHRDYSTDKTSAFHGSGKKPKPFCEFEFNNNSGNDQHIVLRALASQPSLGGSVSYVFPRVPNVQTFKACIGRLIHVTSVFTVAEMDAAAKAKGVTIAKGNVHKLRTSYTSPLTSELCSDPVRLEFGMSSEGDLFADIVAARTCRTLEVWQAMLRENWNSMDFEQVNWPQLFRAFEVEIGRYLAVDSGTFREAIRDDVMDEDAAALDLAHEEFFEFQSGLEEMLGLRGEERSERDSAERGTFIPGSHRRNTMQLTAKKLFPYKRLMQGQQWLEAPIPKPETSRITPLGGTLRADFSAVQQQLDDSEFNAALASIAVQAI